MYLLKFEMGGGREDASLNKSGWARFFQHGSQRILQFYYIGGRLGAALKLKIVVPTCQW